MSKCFRGSCARAILPALLLTAACSAHGGSITSVAISGAGLGASSYTVDNVFVVPTVYYTVEMTKLAPIDFVIGVDSPGRYDLSFRTPPGSVLNSTGVTITSLLLTIVSGPSGTSADQLQLSTNLPLPNPVFPNSMSVGLNGPPNLASGSWGAIGMVFDVGGTGGPQTVTIRLTANDQPAVPEPASLVSLGIGAALVGLAIRKGRRAV